MAEKRAFPKQNPITFLARHESRQKCCGPASTPLPLVESLVVVAGSLADHTTEPANGLWIWHGCC